MADSEAGAASITEEAPPDMSTFESLFLNWYCAKSAAGSECRR